MRLAFAGTPQFAVSALDALLQAGHDVALVLTQPDRAAGRGLKLQASAVKQRAQQQGLTVVQPTGLRLDGRAAADASAAQAALAAARVQAVVVVAYGLILPQWLLDLPPLGCFNIHASLLPRWRGAAPVHRAIEAGDARTGVSIMQMDAGLDTGDVLLAQSMPIGPEDTTASLQQRLAELGAQLMVRVLDELPQLRARPQSSEGVCYAAKVSREEAAIDWRAPARLICQRVRAFNPFPVATLGWQGQTFKVWSAHAQGTDLPPGSADATPGTVLAVTAQAVLVATGEGVLAVTELQRAGSRRMGLADFLMGCPLAIGQTLDCAGA